MKVEKIDKKRMRRRYRMLDEEEFFDLIDEQMKASDCMYCHGLAMAGEWKTEINPHRLSRKIKIRNEEE